jgi:hypothetical protein
MNLKPSFVRVISPGSGMIQFSPPYCAQKQSPHYQVLEIAFLSFILKHSKTCPKLCNILLKKCDFIVENCVADVEKTRCCIPLAVEIIQSKPGPQELGENWPGCPHVINNGREKLRLI